MHIFSINKNVWVPQNSKRVIFHIQNASTVKKQNKATHRKYKHQKKNKKKTNKKIKTKQKNGISIFLTKLGTISYIL